jgi:hypothetical protein
VISVSTSTYPPRVVRGGAIACLLEPKRRTDRRRLSGGAGTASLDYRGRKGRGRLYFLISQDDEHRIPSGRHAAASGPRTSWPTHGTWPRSSPRTANGPPDANASRRIGTSWTAGFAGRTYDWDGTWNDRTRRTKCACYVASGSKRCADVAAGQHPPSYATTTHQ